MEYTKKTWRNGEVIYEEDLNNMEEGIDEALKTKREVEWNDVKNKPEGLVQDENYNHTDNNYDNESKTKVNELKDIKSIGEGLSLSDEGELSATGSGTEMVVNIDCLDINNVSSDRTYDEIVSALSDGASVSAIATGAMFGNCSYRGSVANSGDCDDDGEKVQFFFSRGYWDRGPGVRRFWVNIKADGGIGMAFDDSPMTVRVNCIDHDNTVIDTTYEDITTAIAAGKDVKVVASGTYLGSTVYYGELSNTGHDDLEILQFSCVLGYDHNGGYTGMRGMWIDVLPDDSAKIRFYDVDEMLETQKTSIDAEVDEKIAEAMTDVDNEHFHPVTVLPDPADEDPAKRPKENHEYIVIEYEQDGTTIKSETHYLFYGGAYHEKKTVISLDGYATEAYVLSQVTPKAEVGINESSNAMEIVGGGRHASFNVNTDGDMEMMLAEPNVYLKTATVPSKTNVEKALAEKQGKLEIFPDDREILKLDGKYLSSKLRRIVADRESLDYTFVSNLVSVREGCQESYTMSVLTEEVTGIKNNFIYVHDFDEQDGSFAWIMPVSASSKPGGGVVLRGILNGDLVTYDIEYDNTSKSYVWKKTTTPHGGGADGYYRVTITKDAETGKFSADKTFAEIKEQIQQGKVPLAVYDGTAALCLSPAVDDYIFFRGVVNTSNGNTALMCVDLGEQYVSVVYQEPEFYNDSNARLEFSSGMGREDVAIIGSYRDQYLGFDFLENGGLEISTSQSVKRTIATQGYVDGKALTPTGWGVARTGIATVTFNSSKWSSSATVDVSEFGFSSGADYDVVAQPTTGGTATPWGNAIAFVNADKGASSFSVSSFTMEESLSGTVNVKYTIFAKGYGGSSGGAFLTDGDWRYKINPDNTFEAFYSKSGVSLTIQDTSGNFYRSALQTLNLPTGITSAYDATPLHASVNTSHNNYPCFGTLASVATNQIKYYALSGGSRGASPNYIVTVHMFGTLTAKE